MTTHISKLAAAILLSVTFSATVSVLKAGTLTVYLSPPAAQSSTVSGVATETFDALSTGVRTTAYTSVAGIGTYTGSSSHPMAILAPNEYGGATDSMHTSTTNYFAVGNATSSTAPVTLALTHPAAYFGFWWSAGDASNRVDLYQGSTLYASFSTQNLLTFLNNGVGTVTAINGSTYQTSAYFGNPNLTSGNDSGEPFVYVSFVITGTTIDTIKFYNVATASSFESDNHSVISSGSSVTIPTTYVQVESLALNPTAATPTFSPLAGTYTSAQTVTISTTTSGASIRYTTNGTTPSETVGTLYSTPVSVGVTGTLNSIAYKSGLTDSAVASAAYTINLPAVATPTFSPAAGTYTGTQSVTISSTTSGASIRYTTDGSTPSETAGTLYSAAVSVPATETLKAIAYKTGMADSTVASAAYTIVTATPTFSPAAGTYTSVQTVTISSATSGASIRYTTDGSTPSETAGTLYSAAVSVGVTETLKAIAYKTGFSDSTVASGAYTINLPAVANPTFSPVAGTYTSVQSVTISSTTSGASIRYTTDGGTPSETVGTLYSAAVSVGVTETLKAIAYKTGMSDSAVESAAYTINLPAVATPTFNPVAGTYTGTQTVAISSATSGASVRYTTDGSTPSETVGTLYGAAVSVTVTETLKAIAYKTGMSDSTVASAAYTIVAASPTFSPAAGTYTSLQTVTISSATSGASVRYTTDGSTPSETAGTLYSAPVSVGVTETLKAIAYETGLADSTVASAAYTINLPVVASPTYSPTAGTYTSVQTVTISTTTSGASIRYTTDGSTPSETAGTLYSAPVSVSTSETINAIAYKSGMTDSTIATAAYTIAAAPPTFNPPAGTYSTAQTVTIATTTSGASIRYTTDGSTPSETAGTLYSGAVSVSANETLNAIAYKTGLADSTVATAAYVIALPVATPTVTPGAGAYTSSQAVTISTATSGATIRYTTDGSTPSETVGTIYSAPIPVSVNTTINAIAYKSGMSDSAVASAAYTFPISVTVSPAPATLSGGQTLQFTANVINTTNTAVTWTAAPAGVGSVSASGLFTAPASVSSAQIVSVTATSVADATKSSTAVLGLTPVGTVWISPQSMTLSASQTQQFSAGGAFGGNDGVTWSISPAGLGSIDNTGFYTAPSCIFGTQNVTLTATSVANSSVAATATVTLLNANGYSYSRAVTIDHTKVPNTDQANFPFLFNTTDPAFATLANGGHMTNVNGYDIIFATDPGGENTLNYELEQSNPVTGQLIAWVRIPTLSHTADTVLYVFYGNLSVTTSQANPTAVWDKNYKGVWHFSTPSTLSALDSTANADNGTINGSPSVIGGQIGWAADFAGVNDDVAIQSIPLAGVDYTISAWFSMPLPSTNGSANTLTRGVNSDHQVLFINGNLGAYGNQNGGFWNSGFNISTLSDGWHHLAANGYQGNTDFYVDGVPVGSIPFQSTSQISFLGNYQGGGQQLGATDEIRISTGISRTADWIATEYNNQNSPSAFYGLAAETAVSLTVFPTTVSLIGGQTQQFTSGQPSTCGPAITWSLNPAGAGTIDATGLYTAPAVATQQTVTVTAQTANPAETATATLTVLPPVTVSPTTGSLYGGQTLQFSAVANGSVTWSVTPSGAGSISSTGLYTASQCVTTQTTVTVTAAASAGQTASASVTLLAANGYGYSRIVVIDHTKVPNTDQANFPFLFNTTDPAFANTANGGRVTSPNGYDLIFSTDPNGLIPLNFELQQYNPATGQVIAWVRIPTLSHTTDTVLYVFYGNTAITTSQANKTGVWDGNFQEVLHLDEANGATVFDSTANANNGTKVSASSPTPNAAGEIGAAQSFNGTSDFIVVPPSVTAGLTVFSTSFWAKTTGTGNNGTYWNQPAFLGDSTSGNNSGDFGIVTNSGDLGMWSGLNGRGDNSFLTSTLINDNNWHYISAVNNGSIIHLYLDGQDVGQTLTSGLALDTFGWYLGAQHYVNGGAAFYHQGAIDEFRFSNSVRTPDWISTEFNNQSSPSTFYTVFPESQQVSLAPAAITLYASQTQQFASAVLANCNQGLTWTINPSNAGTISATGLYTAPASIATQQPVTVTATSQANSANFASATVTLYAPETVTVAPATVPIYGGQTQKFTATVANATNSAVTWSVSPASVGTLDATGLYTAPATITTQQTLTVTATSQQNSAVTGTATVTLFPSVAVSVSPTTSILYGGQTQQFSATVTDTINPAVTWSISPAGVGSITAGGLYSAPASVTSIQPITVTATSVTDPSKFAGVALNLAPQGTVLVFPQTVTLAPSQTQQFAAEVASANTAVTWTINPPSPGSINSTGLYTSPATNCNQQTVTVTATSVANPSQSSTATIVLSNANGFSYQRAITINHTQVPNTDQTNFPVLISGTYPWLATTSNGGHVTNPNGYDIVFTSDPTCVTKLNFEVEQWNAQTGVFVGWVRIPTLSHTSDTVIYACYGNASISTDQSNGHGTWDGTFEGVWHFPNGTVLSANDSTSNANNATSLNGTSATAGKIDGAARFNGSNYLAIPNSPSLNNWTVQTVSMWVNIQPGMNGGFTRLVEKGTGQEWSIFWSGSDEISITSPVTEDVNSTSSLGDGQWHKIDVTIDSNLVSIYVDGNRNITQASFAPPSTNGNLVIGAYPGGGSNFYRGLADELRIANVERSPDWITASYNSENSPSTFYTLGSESSGTLTVSPDQPTLYASQTQQYTAAAPASCGSAFTWSVNPPGFGTISAAGVYTAPSSIPAQQTVTITATSQTDTTKSASSIALLLPPVSIGITPTVTSMYNGNTQQFLATVSNAVNTGITWSLSPSGSGSISATGLYTAPASITTIQTVTLTATSLADPASSVTATITLEPGSGAAVQSTPIGAVLSLIADSLCRRPHAAPVVTMTFIPPFGLPGQDQYITLNCPSGPSSCAASTTVSGIASSYTLAPGDSLTYGWSLFDGPAPVQFSAPTATSTSVAFTAAGVYTLQLTANDGLSTGTGVTHVIVSPATQGGGDLYLTPVVSGPNPVNSTVAMQLKLVGFFYGVYNCQHSAIQVAVTGANPLTTTVYTDSNGNATFSYTGLNAGSDLVTATANSCANSSFTSNTVPVTWIVLPPNVTSTPVTGQFFTADGSGVFNTPATQQPLFTQTFPNIDFNPPSGTPTVTNLTRPFTDVMTDSNGNFVGVLPAQGNNYQAGAGTLYSFSAVFTGAFNVPVAGPVTFNFTSDDAFIFGVGNTALPISGPQTNTPVTTTFTGLPVMGGVNGRQAPASNAITVNFPEPGVYPYEVDYAKGGDKNLTLTMLTGGVPVPPAALLTLSPSQAPSIQIQQVESLNISAQGSDGTALASLPVTVTVTGVNQQTRPVTTDGAGQAGIAYASDTLVGVDQVQATAVVNGMQISSNIVSVPWNNGTNQAPVVSAGGPQTIVLPSQAVLSGTATDDGLPSNTLTTTWSVVTGPGTVTFDDANQPGTAATFNVPGTYTLQLSASDGALTTNSTVTITVSANNNLTTGWILSPAASAAISGQVPITLISGVTLVSGTLTYFPANNPQAVVTVNANTTGSGQIATLDATLLNNGGYFILLNGTNSQNVTQTSQVYVTAVGDYKPGRVTATITDLTVPAPGLPIQIQRTYDSLVRGTSSDFGYGWRLGINIQTQVSPTGDVTLTINGKTRTFYFTPPNNGLFTYWYTPQYTPEPGLYGSLSNTGDNCSGVLLHVGNVWECAISNEGQIYQATGYQYTDPYGRIYTLASDGTLQSVQDLNNNTLTITPTGITSSNGLNVPFTRDSQGRITQITDLMGNHYQYAYDANGNLASVTYPSIATPAQFQYDSTHLLTQETDRRGNIAGTTTYYADGKLESITDAVGNTTQYAYSLARNTTTVTNPDGGTAVTVADSYGDPLEVTDPLGRTTTNTYDANHNLLTTTDPLGKTTTYTYDSNGFRTSLKDPLGNISSTTFDAIGRPTSMTDPLGNITTLSYGVQFNPSAIVDGLGQVGAYSYTPQGLASSVQDARGGVFSYTYDQHGNQSSSTDPLKRTTNLNYDAQGNLASYTDPRGNVTGYSYDALNRRASMTDAYGKQTAYAYDGNGNKVSETNRRGFTTNYKYDPANQLIETDYSDGTKRSVTYDWRHNTLTETDQLNRVTKYTYDIAGQLLSTTVAYSTGDQATTSYTYDLDGRKLAQSDPRGNITSHAYDAAGRMTSLTDAVGNSTQYGYDAKDQQASMTDAKNRTTYYSYDLRGRQLSVTTPDGRSTSKTVDGLGLILSKTDEEGRTIKYSYDGDRQLVSVTDALNQTTQYGYDPGGNLASQTDANGRITTYAFDSLNRRISRILPLSQIESLTYDAEGNLASRTDFNGKTTTYTYDSLNRQLSRTPDASFGSAPTGFTYTPTGQRLTMTDPSGVTTYIYTNRDQVASKATPRGALAYTYDLSGSVASVVSSNVNGTNVQYAWDADNRLQSVTDDRSGGVTNYTYDQTSMLTTMGYPNGVVHTFGYDDRDRTISLNVTNGPATVASYAQTYSPSGHKLSAAEENGRTPNYGYDSIYRLVTENIGGDPTASNNGSLNYSLDPVGNRLAVTSTLAALQSESFTYDANDRFVSDTYDANGNTLSSGGVNYGYEFEDRLISTSTGVQIVYDGDGNRVSETAGGLTTNFLIDTQTPTRYAEVAEEVVGGSVGAQFTYGTMRISQNRAGVISYYGYDASGSTRQLLNDSGAVTDMYAYDAFGNTVAQSGPTANEFQYRGEQYDPSISLYDLRDRWYRPGRGAFLGMDRADAYIYQPQTLHKYAYTESDPVNKKDPSGLQAAAEVAQVEGDVDMKEYVAVAVAFASVCYIENCGRENEGKWQAQGSDFGTKHAGIGITKRWLLPIALPKLGAELLVTALMDDLNETQFENRIPAYSKAMAFIATTTPQSQGFTKSFPFPRERDPGWRKLFSNNRSCPDADCRIDVEVDAGLAFTPLFLGF